MGLKYYGDILSKEHKQWLEERERELIYGTKVLKPKISNYKQNNMKANTEVVLVEKGKAIEAHVVLNKAGINTFGSARLKWDWNTAFISCAITMLFGLGVALLIA